MRSPKGCHARSLATRRTLGSAADGVGVLEQAEASALVAHRVQVREVGEWSESMLGFDPRRGVEWFDRLATPSHRLAEVTPGAVFHDGLGELGPIRARLAYYPDDVWRFILASQWTRISEEESFVGRCAQVGDDLGSSCRSLAPPTSSSTAPTCCARRGSLGPAPRVSYARRALQVQNSLHRERRLSERTSGQVDEQQRAVVGRSAVESQLTTASASMDKHPLTLAPHRNGDGLHGGAAISGAVAGVVAVEVTAPETAGTVVAMGGARCIKRHIGPAITAPERARPPRSVVGVQTARQAEPPRERRRGQGRRAGTCSVRRIARESETTGSDRLEARRDDDLEADSHAVPTSSRSCRQVLTAWEAQHRSGCVRNRISRVPHPRRRHKRRAAISGTTARSLRSFFGREAALGEERAATARSIPPNRLPARPREGTLVRPRNSHATLKSNGNSRGSAEPTSLSSTPSPCWRTWCSDRGTPAGSYPSGRCGVWTR
jgi:hypothetical protein